MWSLVFSTTLLDASPLCVAIVILGNGLQRLHSSKNLRRDVVYMLSVHRFGGSELVTQNHGALFASGPCEPTTFHVVELFWKIDVVDERLGRVGS